MRLIDCHVHVFPDAVAATAVPALAARCGLRPAGDGTRAALERQLAQAGVMAALNCPIATKPEQTLAINNWAARANRFPVFSLGTVHPDTPGLGGELRRVKQLGLPGIKLHPEYQGFALDDPRLEPVWESCATLKLPVLLHAGADLGFPPPWRTRPADFRRLRERWPRLRLVAAHFGGWRMWDEVERELLGSPVWLDLSFTGELPAERLAAMVRRHGAERVLFASDTPWDDLGAAVARFQALPLTPAERERVAWRNAAELFQLQLPA
ncbi:MAG: amidohydrolase family protein [Lentisphaeria bacterium]|jgi:hypothetical protein